MVTLSIRKRGTPAGSFMFRLPRVRRERPGRRAAEQRDVQNRGRHAINVVTVITGPCVGYAKFFGRIPSAGFHKTSLAPVVVRWTRPTVLSSDPMSPIIITLLVLLGVGLLLALLLMGIYNGLVVAGNRFKNAFAQIDVQLKRRYELIPNLVEAVKGYMG